MKRVIEDLVIKSHRTDRKIKDRCCAGRWFDLDHFPLEAGCKIVNSDGELFIVTKVDYKDKRPKYAICQTVKKSA